MVTMHVVESGLYRKGVSLCRGIVAQYLMFRNELFKFCVTNIIVHY